MNKITLIDKLEKDALIFMDKRKNPEIKIIDSSIKIIDDLEKNIINTIKSHESINISYIPTFIENVISPIIEDYKIEHEALLNNIISYDFEIGIINAQNFLSSINQGNIITGDIKDEKYQEVLISLLLYSKILIDNLYSNLLKNIEKDMISIYITNKNQSNYKSANKEINTDDIPISTVLTGAIIARYINSTFNNIRNRARLIARNETNRALNHGLIMEYLKNGNIKKVKWVEVRDNKLCKHCKAAANGGEFKNGVYDILSINPPPLHPNCRCILIPYKTAWTHIYY